MNSQADSGPIGDVREARSLFPATDKAAYFNTAAVGLASRTLAAAYHSYVDAWTETGLDYVRGEAAGENARSSVAAMIGADRSDVALIASVSAAAGLVAAQFGPARRGHNVVIGEREYSSNHYPWRLLATKGYDVREVPFRNGGLEPDDIALRVDGGTLRSHSAACRPRRATGLMSRRSARSREQWAQSSSSMAHNSSARCRSQTI